MSCKRIIFVLQHSFMEKFKKCPASKDYEVGNMGTVNGLKRKNIGSVVDGFKQVYISGKFHHVHKLMWEAFESKIPEGGEIRHKDGNKLNNILENLELVVDSEVVLPTIKKEPQDIKDFGKETRFKMGEKKIGSKNPMFKGWYVVNGIEYENTASASEATGIHPKKIYRDCKAEKNNCKFREIESHSDN